MSNKSSKGNRPQKPQPSAVMQHPVLAPATPLPAGARTLPALTPQAMPSWVTHTPRRSPSTPAPTKPAANKPTRATPNAPMAAMPSPRAGDLRSAIEHVAWPAIPTLAHQLPLVVQFQLEQTQWWAPERLRAHQFHQLGFLVRHAAATVPYYQQLFKRIGLDPKQPPSAELWQDLPILTRRELQENLTTLRAEAPPEAHGKQSFFDSSGSTGTPIRVYKTELQEVLYHANTLRDHLWHKRDLSGRMASISEQETLTHASYPDGKTLASWGTPCAAFATGGGFVLNLATKVHQQAEWLQRIQPDYLVTFPSNLEAVARYFHDNKLALPSLRQVRTMSEPVKPEQRDLCREIFGVELKDTYSTEEIGYIASQSPVTEELLVHAETNLVEIVDEQGRACEPGQVGRVIVTPLHAFAMPLIRYAIGDLAEAGGAAKCGRGLPVIKQVLGRERHMVRLPNGQLHYPSYHYLTRGLDKIVQFQIVRKTVELLEVRLVARVELDTVEEGELRRRVQERFHYPFAVRFVYAEEIARTPGGKFFDYVSEID